MKIRHIRIKRIGPGRYAFWVPPWCGPLAHAGCWYPLARCAYNSGRRWYWPRVRCLRRYGRFTALVLVRQWVLLPRFRRELGPHKIRSWPFRARLSK